MCVWCGELFTLHRNELSTCKILVLGQAVTAPVVLTVDLRGTSFMTVEGRFSLGGNNYVLTLSLYIITCAI
jgi:aerobic-type carbon monoxide dehydrogenase small subunit (CoxS/CutS family)